MKLIIAGSRDIAQAWIRSKYAGRPISSMVEIAMEELGVQRPDRVICGCALGVDVIGYMWARAHHVPVDFYPGWESQWEWAAKRVDISKELLKSPPVGVAIQRCGFVRNGWMADDGDALLSIWDGSSRGTLDMRAKMGDKLIYPFDVVPE